MHEQVVLRRLHILTFEQLRTFLATVHAGSVSRAADSLLLTPSAVSQRLKQMEVVLGTPVFDRAPGQPLRLKFAGELALKYAEEILRLLDELQEAIDEQVLAGKAPMLTLALGSSASRHLLPHLLDQLPDRYPATRIVIREGTADEMAEMVMTGVADLGIQMEPRAFSPELRKVPFKMDRFGLCAPAGSGFDSSSRSVQGLAGRSFALPSRGAFRDVIDQWMQAMGVRLSPVLETTNLEAMVEFVAHGLGLAFLPEFVVRDQVGACRLDFTPIFGMPSALPLYVTYDGRRDLSEAARDLLAVVRAEDWRRDDWRLDGFAGLSTET